MTDVCVSLELGVGLFDVTMSLSCDTFSKGVSLSSAIHGGFLLQSIYHHHDHDQVKHSEMYLCCVCVSSLSRNSFFLC